MILKEYLKSGKHIIDSNIASTVSTFYNVNSIPWLSSSYIDIYERTIKAKYCLREMYEETETDIKELTTLMFLGNYDKYKHIYDLLLMSYNPLWNVDGTETTTRNLTDNKTSSNTGTNTLTHNTTDARTTGETITHNTTDTTTYNTTDGKNTTDSRTTFNSNTFYDTDKTTDSLTKTGTEATARTGTEGTTGTDSTSHTGTETTDAGRLGCGYVHPTRPARPTKPAPVVNEQIDQNCSCYVGVSYLSRTLYIFCCNTDRQSDVVVNYLIEKMRRSMHAKE